MISLNRTFQDLFNDISYVIDIKNFLLTNTMFEISFRFLMVKVSVIVSENNTIEKHFSRPFQKNIIRFCSSKVR